MISPKAIGPFAALLKNISIPFLGTYLHFWVKEIHIYGKDASVIIESLFLSPDVSNQIPHKCILCKSVGSWPPFSFLEILACL